MKKISQSIIVFVLLVALASCESETTQNTTTAAKTSLTVNAYKVVSQPFSSTLKTTANLLAKEQVELMAPITGQVLAIYFKEGQYIRKGQSIVRLDDRAWQAELLGVKAEISAAENDLTRKHQLLEVEGSTQEEVDNAYAKLELLRSQQQQLLVNISLANVTAPFSGQLGMRDFSEGAFLSQGDVITVLSANDQLKVDFTLAQAYANSIEINKPVQVVIGKDTLVANVYAINPVINSDTRMISVRALLKQKAANKIKPGSYAEVIIPTEAIQNAILVPTQAVVPNINEQTVYISKNGKAVRKIIEMGNRTADNVLILDGLSEGDTVITTGLLQIKEGMDLNIETVK